MHDHRVGVVRRKEIADELHPKLNNFHSIFGMSIHRIGQVKKLHNKGGDIHKILTNEQLIHKVWPVV
jgi:hypothetical protein